MEVNIPMRWILAFLSVASIVAQAQAQCALKPPALSDSQLSTICATDAAYSSPACSLYRLCWDSTLTPAIFPQLCNTTRLASSLCLDDPSVVAAIPECASLAAQRATAISFPCNETLGIFSVRSTLATRQAAINNCAQMGGFDMAGCDKCDQNSCPDPFVALGEGCADMRDMSECKLNTDPDIRTFCDSPKQANITGLAGQGAAILCLRQAQWASVTAPPRPPPAGAPVASPPVVLSPSPSPSPSPVALSPPIVANSPPPTAMASPPLVVASPPNSIPPPIANPPAAASPPPSIQAVSPPGNTAPLKDACITNPTTDSCASYTYPTDSINADVAMMCSDMPDMPGCSIQTACKAGYIDANSQTCAPMSLLATLCADMLDMRGCANAYKTMCQAGSKVPQCAAFPPLPKTPTWDSSRQAVFSICSDMSMTQCAECTQSSCPDPLNTFVGLCKDMPTMRQCTAVDSWCNANGGSNGGLSYFCSAGGSQSSGLPSMLMYFHQRWEEIILWKEWVPKTQGQYVGTIFAILGFGVTSMVLRTLAIVLSIRWRHPAQPLAARRAWWLPAGSQVSHNCIKGLIMAVATCIDYFNMLVAMTFNIGLFVAVVCGYALGTLLMSHVPDNYSAYLAAQRADDTHRLREAVAAAKMEQGIAVMDSSSGTPVSREGAHLRDTESPQCCPAPM